MVYVLSGLLVMMLCDAVWILLPVQYHCYSLLAVEVVAVRVVAVAHNVMEDYYLLIVQWRQREILTEESCLQASRLMLRYELTVLDKHKLVILFHSVRDPRDY